MNTFIEKIFTAIVQREGRKFLSLKSGYDPSIHDIEEQNQQVSSLYIHVPYCKVLCPYCSFNRYLYDEIQARKYFEALTQEARIYKQKGFRFTHIYLGGGTPTVNLDLLFTFLENLKNMFPIQQISMETNPADLTPETVSLLQKMGVNRLSIGVQSFNDDELHAMGRFSHTGLVAKEKIKLALGHFQTVNIDLMFNFPTQTVESFLKDLETFKQIGADQVTFYPLMPSPHKKTKLEKQFNTIKTDREFKFYHLILENLLPDYHVSTVWCFSKGQRMIDEYIIEYEDYVGIGAGSVSFLEGTFLVNSFDPVKYIQILDKNQLPIVLSKKSTKRDHSRYFLLTKLFGMRMNLVTYHQKFGHVLFWEILALRLLGFVKKEDQELLTTRKGMYYIGIMMKNFFATLNHLREYCIESKI